MAQAVFLDRDGTLNQEIGYIREVDKLILMPGIGQAVRRLNDAGILAILTTNQSGVARGFYGEEHIHALHDRLQRLLKNEADAKLDAVFYCPHHPRGVIEAYAMACHCRKPEPGMIEAACKQFGDIDLKSSYVLGDKASDVEFGRNARCKTILLKTGYGQRVLDGKYQELKTTPDHVCENLVDAVEIILKALQ